MSSSYINGIGKALPKKVVSNGELSTFLETDDEWISTRTGIKNRRIVTDETALSLAVDAAKSALSKSSISEKEIDLVICATMSADNITPGIANLLQNELGLDEVMTFDVNAACSGFVYAMEIANSFIKSGSKKNILVLGVEVLSRMIDWSDRNTAVLFGDGAGACILSSTQDKKIESVYISKSKSDDTSLLAKNSGIKDIYKNTQTNPSCLSMVGSDVFKFATRKVPEIIKEVLDKSNTNINDIKLIVPHQANYRIVKQAAKKLDINEDKFFLNIDKYGNTSAASVPLALCEAIEEGKINRGDKIIIVGFGAGLTWSCGLIEY